jgi:hypothetical protein
VSGDGKGDVMSGTDRTVEGDGGGNDDVTDGTEDQLRVEDELGLKCVTYMAPAASRQLRPSEI